MTYQTATDGQAWLAEVRAHIARSDMVRVTARSAAEDFGMSETTLHHRLRKLGTTFKRLKNAERHRRLLEAIEDAPTSTPEFLAELCGYVQLQSFDDFFRKIIGLKFNEYRRRHGMPPAKLYKM